jgi:hypothetical protein
VTATVVYVHGNGNKVRRELLKAEWDEALFGRDVGTRSVMAYWAPLRYPEPLSDAAFDELEQPAAVDLPADEVSTAPAGLNPIGLQAEAWMEIRAELGVEAAAEGLGDDAAALDRWLLRMAYQADALAEGESSEALRPGIEAIPLPRAARVAIFRALVKVSFKDVYAYFFGGFGDAMRGIVRNAIAGTDGPVIMVSHSLGTIIAYDLLRETGLNRDIPLFVTAGSPLGVQEIQDLVAAPLRVPAGVAAWCNVCDARDLVALDSTIRPEYDPASRCSDFLVTNDSPNHHGILEYLTAAPIRNAVLPSFV